MSKHEKLNYQKNIDENIMVIETDLMSDCRKNEKWTHASTMCLLEILWEEFDRAKSGSISVSQRELFERASKEMKTNGFCFSKEDLKRRYKFLVLKYRNIRSLTFGTDELHSWPYFELVSEVYKKEQRIPRSCKARVQKGTSFSSRKPSVKHTIPNIATPPGVFISNTSDLRAFTSQWEAKQFANEDQKLGLLETLFKDLSAERSDAENDVLIRIKMRNEKLKYLKQIISEMNEFRINLKNEFSVLTELINEIIVALRDYGHQGS